MFYLLYDPLPDLIRLQIEPHPQYSPWVTARSPVSLLPPSFTAQCYDPGRMDLLYPWPTLVVNGAYTAMCGCRCYSSVSSDKGESLHARDIASHFEHQAGNS